MRDKDRSLVCSVRLHACNAETVGNNLAKNQYNTDSNFIWPFSTST